MRCRTPSSVPLLAATFGLLLASSLQAADPPLSTPAQKANTTEPVVIDVALRSRRLAQWPGRRTWGKPAAGVALFVLRGTTPVATCQTDQSGGFAVPGLAGGLYEIRCQQGALACRVWASGTAPPSAQPGLLLTTGARRRSRTDGLFQPPQFVAQRADAVDHRRGRGGRRPSSLVDPPRRIVVVIPPLPGRPVVDDPPPARNSDALIRSLLLVAPRQRWPSWRLAALVHFGKLRKLLRLTRVF